MSYSKVTEILRTPQRIHPLFPLRQETQQDPTLAFSDHLPILTQVPLPHTDSTLNIISLNILGGINCSGIHDRESIETREETTARYVRMIDGLLLGIRKHDVDILAFQEATPEFIMPVLDKKLRPDWEIIEDNIGVITCYRKENWTLQKTSVEKRNKICSLTLNKVGNPNLTVDFHNIWGAFDQFPLNLENQCREALAQGSSNVRIIMGDTNSRIAPLDGNVRNITTGAIPHMFNKLNGVPDEVQVPDYPDGGFYQDEQGKIHQLQTQVLSFEEGSIVNDQRTPQEVHPWHEYRMVMCLDSQFFDMQVINNQTVFEYENFLRNECGNNDILVRVAADCFNRKALGIGLPKNSDLNKKFNFIKEYLSNEIDFQFKEFDSQNSKDEYLAYNCVFAPRDKIHLLHEAIEAYLFQEKHPILAFFKTPSWKRNALIGIGVSVLLIAITVAIISVTMGLGAFMLVPPLLASLGTVFTSLPLMGFALAGVSLLASVAVGLGYSLRIREHYEVENVSTSTNEGTNSSIKESHAPEEKGFSPVITPTILASTTPPKKDVREETQEEASKFRL